MKNLKRVLIFVLVFTVIGLLAGVGISYAQEGGDNIGALFTSTMTLMMTGIGFCAGVILALSMKPKKDKNAKKNTGETASGEKTDLAFDSKFMDPKAIKNNSSLISTSWDKLPSLQKTGFPFRFKQNGGNYEIAMNPESHCLVIGTTGTGKTQILANPTIRILAHSGEKPSLVMTDPKGELYRDNYNILKKEGYKVIVLDLNDPYSSSRWNPMEPAYDTYQRATHLTSEVKKFSNCSPEEMGYKKLPEEDLEGYTYGDSWFGFDGRAFPSNELLKKELDAKKKQLETSAKEVLKNIANSLIPVPPDSKDPVWTQGSQSLVQGIMEAMLEDSRYAELGMTKEKFNFFNLYKTATRRDQAMGSNDSQLKTLSQYAEGRDPVTSNVPTLMSAVCGASPVTQRSFLATLGSSLSTLLGDDGILYMTSGTDINFRDLVDQPTAFFIKAPDHKSERHPLAVLCVMQLYKTLVDIAENEGDGKGKKGMLKRQVFMILDEFGNMPAFEKFGQMVTVARSRGIRIEIILQSYKQLDIKYGAEEAQNIKGNFQTEIFLGSEDQTTIEAFSKACGEITVFKDNESESYNDKKKDEGKSIQKSTERLRRPLIDQAELRVLEKWTVIAKLFRQPILKEVMTPFYQTKCMEKSTATAPVSVSKSLDEEKIFYDIETRNKLLIKPKNPFGF